MSDPIKNAENATIVPTILHIRPVAILSTFSNPNQSSRLASRIKAYGFRFDLKWFIYLPASQNSAQNNRVDQKLWREKGTSQGRLRLLASPSHPGWLRLEDSSRWWKSLKCPSESQPLHSRKSSPR